MTTGPAVATVPASAASMYARPEVIYVPVTDPADRGLPGLADGPALGAGGDFVAAVEAAPPTCRTVPDSAAPAPG